MCSEYLLCAKDYVKGYEFRGNQDKQVPAFTEPTFKKINKLTNNGQITESMRTQEHAGVMEVREN